ncbi:MAG: hypothetical protein A2Y76_14920 [Planctomycetes bacterium RBG_13_60_9]|nr:MAG: hypothetical protein A2Y76_14920 [Planctomycetes bacterium RBG_13_60_9]
MHILSDTIVAVSSPAGGVRSILRISGPQTLTVCKQLFDPGPDSPIRNPQSAIRNAHIVSGSMRVSDDLSLDGQLYLFFAPHSYTGDDLAEIHIHASARLVEALVQSLLARGLRPAGPGEFTARAYLNGKLDLAQAEAVSEVISSSNRLQLEAAERLLSGRLTNSTEEIRGALLDCLSLIEAGLDFSGEGIEFISAEQAAERLTRIQKSLEELLAGSIRYETLMDLPAIGIAGAPNAGKSSLLNALLGWERSIVSAQPKTTRDILSGVLTTDRLQCVLFDCAGLIPAPDNVLDELAQRAAMEALNHCSTVIFCVDAAKAGVSEDIAVRALIQPKSLIAVATKSDLSASDELSHRVHTLTTVFGVEFLPVSARTGHGLQDLLDSMERSVVAWAPPTDSPATRSRLESAIGNVVTPDSDPGPQSEISTVALTARHRQAVTDAMESIRQAAEEVNRDNEEVAVMMIRAALQAISEIGQRPIDEQVLDRIFSRFCIGK